MVATRSRTNQKKQKVQHHNKEDKNETPSDIETEILTRLTGRSLIKFRCVSKVWSSFIRSQRFIHDFFSMSSKRSRLTITLGNRLHYVDLNINSLFIFSYSHMGEETSSLVAQLDVEIPSLTLTHRYACQTVHGFVGCCHGTNFTICNPTTRQVKTIPCKGDRTYLGYDPVHDQFKTLTMVVGNTSSLGNFRVHEVITLGAEESRNEFTTPFYEYPITRGLCINGFVYYGVLAAIENYNPVIVCFDVRYERLSFIKAPKGVSLERCDDTMLIEYKGKLAAITRHQTEQGFHGFDLWILEDVKEHEWSKQTFELLFPLAKNMTSTVTNKTGEIIFAPKNLPYKVEPFYIFYYNVESKHMRRVEIHGIADDEGFRRRHGLTITESSWLYVSPDHVESLASL